MPMESSADPLSQRRYPQPAYLLQEFGEVVKELQHPLYLLRRLIRVEPGETFQSGHPFVYPGVVLHCAGTEGIEVGVNAVVELREPGEVADYIQF